MCLFPYFYTLTIDVLPPGEEIYSLLRAPCRTYKGVSFTPGVTLPRHDTTVSIPISNSQKLLTGISAEQIQKLLTNGATAYMLQLNIPSESTKETQELLPAIQEVLDQYKDIFADPTSLPPQRHCDHSIPLVPRATPPMSRPYRVPHKQKDEMEAQIAELLEKKS